MSNFRTFLFTYTVKAKDEQEAYDKIKKFYNDMWGKTLKKKLETFVINYTISVPKTIKHHKENGKTIRKTWDVKVTMKIKNMPSADIVDLMTTFASIPEGLRVKERLNFRAKCIVNSYDIINVKVYERKKRDII